jgi:pyruvate/2-oxoglutarate dehydrogenase complex dihydrolipoamide dehydrogenase (E3) component
MKRTESISSAQVIKKMQPEEFDLVILGGGTGSTIAAWTVAGEGMHVAVVERKYIGGSCPNIACLPSKNIIHSAKVASYFRRSKEFGITHDGFAIDMAGVRERKGRMVRGLNDMYMENYRNTGAEFILGTGRFLAPRTVEVTLADGTTRQLRGANMIVSTGTRAALDTIPGVAEAQPLTHIEALELDEIPEHLLVVGGGYVGVEMSQAMRRFGSKVTMIDRNGRLMSKEDSDVCEALRSLLADEGIDILLNARIKHVLGKCGHSVSVVVEQNGIEKVLKGSHLLIATGRNPNTEGLGPGTDRRGAYRPGIHQGQRAAADHRARRLGDRRGRREPAVHAHQPRRFPRSPCQFNRRQPCDYGQASPILFVYRPRTCSYRSE